MKYLFLVGSNLKRKKLRTFFTICSILMAFLLFGFLAAIRMGLGQGVSVAGADRLISRHKVSIIQTLPKAYKDRILRIKGVKDAMHATWFGGIYQDPKNFFPQMPVYPDDLLSVYSEYELDAGAITRWKENRIGAVVGKTTAERFGFKVGDRVPIQATIWPKADGSALWEFEIVGIYDSSKKGVDLTNFFFRHDYFQESVSEENQGQVGWYIFRVDNPDLATEVAKAVDAEFANSFAETKTETEGAFVLAFAKQIGDVGAIITFVLSAVFFTILLVAGNTMAQSVRERTAELAVLKALGFQHHTVLALVLAESLLISVIGGGIGLILAFVAVSNMDVSKFFPVFFIPTQDVILGVVLVFVLGLLTGVFPALQAMRLQIAVGLRR